MPACATRLLRGTLLGVFFSLLLPVASNAVPWDNQPKLLLHVRAVTSKSSCATWGTLADCRSAVTEGNLSGLAGPYYFVYLLAARGNLPDVAAVQVGLQYQDGCDSDMTDLQRIDVFSWTLCATLEFITPPPHQWPRPGGGTIITWDVTNRCQTGEVAVAGYFYMACYGSNDVLQLIPRPVDGFAKVTRCTTEETILGSTELGMASFSPASFVPGCNPCDGPCPPPAVLAGCGADATPPAAITDLAPGTITSESVALGWTAPGDDGNVGTAAVYDMRYSTSPINAANFDSLPTFTGEPAPLPAGMHQSMTINGLLPATHHYFAIRTADDAPQWSAISNVAEATTGSGSSNDITPPAAITNLAVTNASVNSLTARWTAPGDDGNSGLASQYDLRYSIVPISPSNFGSATPATGEPAPGSPGTVQEFVIDGLPPGTLFYLAIKTADEVPNWSGMSNVTTGTTSGSPTPADPKLLLHVAGVTSKNACESGALSDCQQVVTRGDVTQGDVTPDYFVYLLVGDFSPYTGIAGLQCGVSYQNDNPIGMNDHVGLDVLQWVLCASLEFAGAGWPAPNTGNLITWDRINRCQTAATAVAGYFYVSSYSDDELKLIPRPVDGLARVADCASLEQDVPVEFLGRARFSAGATAPGYNPCGQGMPTPVRMTTWSGIKTLLGP